MKHTTIYFYLLMLLCLPILSVAQQLNSKTDSLITKDLKEKSYGTASTYYNSDIVFLGRKSPIKAPYFSTMVGYYHKSGVYASFGVSYLASPAQKRTDLSAFTVGYNHSVNSFSAGVSATKYFFNKNSYTIESALSTAINGYIDYDFDILDARIDANGYFGTTTDFISSISLNKTFYINNFTILPSVTMNIGTQNYFGNYSNNYRFMRGAPGGMGGGITNPSSMMGGTAIPLKTLNYEASITCSYSLKKFRLYFIPSYAIPLNAALITNGTNTYTESISNSFYWSAGINYIF
ncbi:hypothetical protein [Hydrotalea sp.]|uniref:hypothetical protein n=1 Tax=Hydrotalea sp. TaxID=2881279 RepID=UPI002630EA83|nr:hypothetical protein [Hydrotalea sp.]